MQSVEQLKKLCKLIRYDILTSTTEAGSGHATSSLSAVELLVTLFFGGYFHQDLNAPHKLTNDRFILSKGHASPILYSLYQVAGEVSREELLTLRKFKSNLQGHPTPDFKFCDVATGSLGQGLSIGLGMALGLRLRFKTRITKHETNSNLPNVFVLMGDSEISEGQVWEAAELATYYKVHNLVALLDVNRLGQRGETMLGWDTKTYAKRFQAFGWNTVVIEDGHNIEEIQSAYKMALLSYGSMVSTYNKTIEQSNHKPTIVIAKTIKGKGVSFLENQEGWHGIPVQKDRLNDALSELGDVDENVRGQISRPDLEMDTWLNGSLAEKNHSTIQPLNYFNVGDLVSTRVAYGKALVLLGKNDPNLVVLDSEVSNSTFADTFKKEFPDRFFEMFIAEQNMISVALGLSKIGYLPYSSSFAAFLTRGFDQIRMCQYSYANIKFCGSHSGVFIGQDGPSQMGLEDISMFRSILKSVVLYPSDAVSTTKLLFELHHYQGIGYIRTTREKTPVIYNQDESFKIGGSKTLHQSEHDKVVVFSAGITLHEALKAYKELKKEGTLIAIIDLYSIKPIDEEIIKKFSHLPIFVVEDHYPSGGLGDSVSDVITRFTLPITRYTHLCVRKIPHSGTPGELLNYEEIDSEAIIKAVKSI